MNIIYHNRSNNPEAEKELNAVKVSFDELLGQSDVLISTHFFKCRNKRQV